MNLARKLSDASAITATTVDPLKQTLFSLAFMFIDQHGSTNPSATVIIDCRSGTRHEKCDDILHGTEHCS